jgi:hypothetical protein
MTRCLTAVVSALLLALLAACQSGIDAGDELPAPGEPAVHARRCPHCGWIESKREILPGVADPRAPRSYEYTVRMTDGSSSMFQQALPASWRLGERLTVIGGAGPLD